MKNHEVKKLARKLVVLASTLIVKSFGTTKTRHILASSMPWLAKSLLWTPLGGMLLLGCSNPVGVEPISGTFGLASYNGIPVPADLGPLPPRDGTRDGDECHQIVTEGSLILDGADASFALRFLTVNACTGQVLSEANGSGSYEQTGASLHLVYDGDGSVTSEGIVATGSDGTRIVIQAGIDIELEFRSVPDGAVGSSFP